jgi:beta-lactamase regulating signal transducer with metallopeptidase domain
MAARTLEVVEAKAMHEHIARVIYFAEVHLLFTSVVWLAAWVLTSIPGGSATTRHWIWLATALNFILPLGAIFDKIWAPHLLWATPLGAMGEIGARISENAPAAAVLCAVWLMGTTLMLVRLGLRIRAEHRSTTADELPKGGFLAHGIPVRFAGARRGPAVDGLLHPHISLPCGIDRVLTARELNAVLIHELMHAKRRDNLVRLIYEIGLCGLWFHPLMWIAGARLALYRELSCDESVIQNAHGGELVSALAKLAHPVDAVLLKATASSFIERRLARLTAAGPHRRNLLVNTLLNVVFGAVLLTSVFETVAHTACCFAVRNQFLDVAIEAHTKGIGPCDNDNSSCH